MIPILSSDQLKAWDKHTIQVQGISSTALMDRAAEACANYFISKYRNSDTTCIIFCGNGNNGGDGLAIARLLIEKNYGVEVYLMPFLEHASQDYLIQLDRLKQTNCIIKTIQSANEVSEIVFPQNAIIIDALLGYGTNKPVTGWLQDCISHLNAAHRKIVSIDIPSGVSADGTIYVNAIKAHQCLSFQVPKLCFLFPESGKHCGEIILLDIGLDSAFISNLSICFWQIEKEDINLKRRNRFDYKNTFGHGLLIAGSYGMAGAALLAGKACYTMGCGLLTICSSKENREIIQMHLPEAMYVDYVSDDILSKANAIAIGPGLSKSEEARDFVVRTIGAIAETPLVIDADALNIISQRNLINQLPQNSILTPHAGEFDRLFGAHVNFQSRMYTGIKIAIQFQCFIILKTAYTMIICPDGNVLFNSSGNVGLAKAGSGDVLTGILLALASQKYNAIETCTLGVYLHGMAADLVTKNLSEESVMATDVIANLPNAISIMHQKNIE